MAHQGVSGVVAMVVVIWAGAVSAQSSSSCSNALISLSPCLNYITGNTSTPSSGCCSQLASVVRSQPQCLCEAINGGGGSSLGINVNQTQALALPSACSVQTPPISRCKAASPPSSPAGTPESESPSPPSGGTGSKTLPSTDSGFPAASSTGGTATSLLIPLLFIASYASISISYIDWCFCF